MRLPEVEMRPSRTRTVAVGSVALMALMAWGCSRSEVPGGARAPGAAPATGQTEDGMSEERMDELRDEMVRRQIVGRGVDAPAVVAALRTVPRHLFVPEALRAAAYGDQPLPIGHGQTISQPYIVAFMAQAAEVGPGDRVLEIGTGSGYGAAVLAELAAEVYTVEIVPELAEQARAVLSEAGYDRVHVRSGNGWLGWPEHAPYDAVVVTAAPEHVPEALIEQLAVGGKLVIPVGGAWQTLRVLRKTPDGIVEEASLPVRFVPMVGEPPDTGRGPG